MEDSSYISFKHSLSSIPAEALNCSSREKLSSYLNIKQILLANNDIPRDYRGLAELMEFLPHDLKEFERHQNPTMKILQSWETQPNATLDKLIDYLEQMKRHDVIDMLFPMLDRDVKKYLQRQHLQEIPIQVPEVTSCPVNAQAENHEQIITLDDSSTKECTYYDAYVSYADDDIEDVCWLAQCLESLGSGFKLFIRERDMLAGCAVLDAIIELISNRCTRMLVILTPNYLKSRECEYETSTAENLRRDNGEIVMIPVIMEPCDNLPPIFRRISKVDFTKPVNNWTYDTLVKSLLPKHRSQTFLFASEKSSKQRFTPCKLGSSISFENTPATTSRPSIKQLSDSVDNSVAGVSSTVSNSENPPNDSSAVPSETKKWKSQLYYYLKKARISSSG